MQTENYEMLFSLQWYSIFTFVVHSLSMPLADESLLSLSTSVMNSSFLKMVLEDQCPMP